MGPQNASTRSALNGIADCFRSRSGGTLSGCRFPHSGRKRRTAIYARDELLKSAMLLILGFLLLAHLSLGASQEVEVRLVNDGLQVSAPGLHFLTGKPLEQLRSGLS